MARKTKTANPVQDAWAAHQADVAAQRAEILAQFSPPPEPEPQATPDGASS